MAEKFIGSRARSKEGPRHVTGRGLYTDDFRLPGMLQAMMLRSPHAHAKINSVDPSEALKNPNVVAVVTPDDVKKLTKPFRPGRYAAGLKRPIDEYAGAVDKVRYVGEPIGAVAARDRGTAEDALELIQVDYEPLRAVVDVREAIKPSAAVSGVDRFPAVRRYRRGVQVGRPRRQRKSKNSPLQLHAARALRRHRLLRRGKQALDGLGYGPGAGGDLRRSPRGFGLARHSGDHSRRGRRLRPKDSSDPQVCRARFPPRDEKRPSGQMDRRPERAHDGGRARLRSGIRMRSGGQKRRRRARAPLYRIRRRGRLDQHAHDSLHQQAQQSLQHLSDPSDSDDRQRGGDQQMSGHSQPRHRQTRHVLHLGTHDGSHRPGVGLKPHRGAPKEPHPARRNALPHDQRQRLRQRRLSGAAVHAA